ncbi:MAG TPA: hypothetical protein DER60_12505 [Syntrophomonas sp.]|jgi:uncharacterized membrane protein (GlpM family)|nr:hypothetical protein [Syntrophomonas sp.]
MSWQEGLWRFVCGGLLVLAVSWISKGKNPYFAGLAVLFPVVTVVGYYFLSQSISPAAMQRTVVLSLMALPAVAAFLITCYYLVGRMGIGWTLLSGMAAWLIAAALILQVYQRFP